MIHIDLPASKHFELHWLAEGVYAAIASAGGAAIANAGIIDLGDRTVIFDSFMTPQAARDLRAAAEQLTGRPAELVINSHYHNDHTWGNQAFLPEAQILTSQATLELFTSEGREEFDWYRVHSAPRLAALRQEYDQTDDPAKRAELLFWLPYYEGLVEAFPSLEIKLPTITFEARCDLFGPTRTCQLLAFSGAHTGHDTALFIPEDGILFASDLLFVNCHPYLAEGDPDQAQQALAALGKLAADILVPGHGPVGTPADLTAQSAYIDHCLQASQQLAAAGQEPPGDLAAAQLPAEYQEWELPVFYLANLRAYQERSISKA